MRSRGWLPALALAALCAPLGAEDGPAQTEPDTSESDLRCATWAAFVMGSTEDETAQKGLTGALSWFIGRYEAKTGIRFEKAMTVEYIKKLEPEIPVLKEECLPRMLDLGERLKKHGATLSDAAQ